MHFSNDYSLLSLPRAKIKYDEFAESQLKRLEAMLTFNLEVPSLLSWPKPSVC